MEKTSKVTKVTGNGTWNSQYGTMYKFEVEFANFDIGEYSSKSKDQTNFVVGEETTYDISSKEYQGRTFYTIKPVKAQASFNGGGGKYDAETSKKIARMSVLKCATDLVIAGHVKFDSLFEYAKFLEAYVETGVDSFNTMYAEAEEQKMQGKRDDLPNLPF
jgi:hypothetical protein